jgi:hypothetical protein
LGVSKRKKADNSPPNARGPYVFRLNNMGTAYSKKSEALRLRVGTRQFDQDVCGHIAIQIGLHEGIPVTLLPCHAVSNNAAVLTGE